MIRFDCDYLEGAHPQVLEAIVALILVTALGEVLLRAAALPWKTERGGNGHAVSH